MGDAISPPVGAKTATGRKMANLCADISSNFTEQRHNVALNSINNNLKNLFNN
jgi:hypothetical protein